MSEAVTTNMVWEGHRVVEAKAPDGGMLRWANCADVHKDIKEAHGSLDLPERALVEINGEVTCEWCQRLEPMELGKPTRYSKPKP